MSITLDEIFEHISAPTSRYLVCRYKTGDVVAIGGYDKYYQLYETALLRMAAEFSLMKDGDADIWRMELKSHCGKIFHEKVSRANRLDAIYILANTVDSKVEDPYYVMTFSYWAWAEVYRDNQALISYLAKYFADKICLKDTK